MTAREGDIAVEKGRVSPRVLPSREKRPRPVRRNRSPQVPGTRSGTEPKYRPNQSSSVRMAREDQGSE